MFEVVPPQTDQLHDALKREDDDEDRIDEAQPGFELIRLAVMFERHGDHVQHDDGHDGNVKLLVRRELEEEQLALELKQQVEDITRYEIILFVAQKMKMIVKMEL